jgi:hypothetical protein
MQFHRKPKLTASLLVWRAAYSLLAALGLFRLYIFGEGIWTGEVPVMSKRSSGVLAWSNSPVWFCVMLAVWLGGGWFLLRLAVQGWREDSR